MGHNIKNEGKLKQPLQILFWKGENSFTTFALFQLFNLKILHHATVQTQFQFIHKQNLKK